MRPLAGSDAVLICLKTPVAGSADSVTLCFSFCSFAGWFMVCVFRDVRGWPAVSAKC